MFEAANRATNGSEPGAESGNFSLVQTPTDMQRSAASGHERACSAAPALKKADRDSNAAFVGALCAVLFR